MTRSFYIGENVKEEDVQEIYTVDDMFIEGIYEYIRYTNGITQSINNHLKTIIKTSYGFHNFDRFRKRSMLIITYKTPKWLAHLGVPI